MPPFQNWSGFDAIDPPLPPWEPNPDPMDIEIPGLDTSASINDQIDQMDQLITIKLQNVDANFQRIHDVMATRILPAFRQYAESTEPIREAARFWISFYEAAAKTSMPMNQDVSESHIETTTTTEATEETATYDTTEHAEGSGEADGTYHSFDPERVQDDSTFVPSHGPLSSTPRRPPSSRGPDETDDLEFPSSLSASMETPLQRLGREIQSLNVSDTPASTSHIFHPQSARTTAATPIFTLPSAKPTPHGSRTKGKGKAPQSALREGVLRQNAKRAQSPQKYPTAGTPHRRNPFVEQGQSSKKWDGIVDLIKSPGTPRFSKKSARAHEEEEPDSSTDDLWPPGMSPLQTIKIDIPGVPKPTPRPKREASKRIADDLLATIANQRLQGLGMPPNPIQQGFQSFSTTSSSLSSIPPPDVSRYSKPPSSTKPPRTSISSITSLASFRAQQQQQQQQQQAHVRRMQGSEIPVSQDYDDEDSSFDDDDNRDGGAFQFLVQRSRPAQDNNSDSDSDDDGTVQGPIQMAPLDDDDSFDNDDSLDNGTGGTGTNLFGPPRGSDMNNFNLRGQTLLDDTLGIGNMVKARTGHESVDSPTPFGGR